MRELEPLFDPGELNARLPPALRFASIVFLAAGAGAALFVAVATFRDWDNHPHPAPFLAFVLVVAATALWLAVRLALRRRIATPARAPPRPFLVRVLGLLVFVCAWLAALVTDTLSERIATASFALGGLSWFVWPRRGPRHAA